MTQIGAINKELHAVLRFCIPFAVASACASTAHASYDVPTGCAAPSATFANKFYVDPVNGSMSNDGSAARPWRTLSEVATAGLLGFQRYPTPYVQGSQLLPPKKTAKVFPGDVIILKSGNHGDISLTGAYNSNFITIMAAPGETPVLSRLKITGGSRWVFEGLTFESLNRNATYPSYVNKSYSTSNDFWTVSARADATWGPLDNIIVNGSTLQSKADTSAWTRLDWLTKRASGALFNAGYVQNDYNQNTVGGCLTITNNNFRNIGFGVYIGNASRVNVSKNKIDRFVDDGIDFGGKNITISDNVITNNINDGDQMHRDAIQGHAYWGQNTVTSNIVIQNNTIVNQTDPLLPYPGCLQGVTVFDGIFRNAKISNNSIVTNQYQAMAFYGTDTLEVNNNVVLSGAFPDTCYLPEGDGGLPESGGRNSNAVQSTTRRLAWIAAWDASTGRKSTNVSIHDNISSNYYNMTVAGVTASNNVVANGLGAKGVGVVVAARPDQLFSTFDPTGFRFDLTPVPAALSAIGSANRL